MYSIAVDLDGVIANFIHRAKLIIKYVLNKSLPEDPAWEPDDWFVWGDATTKEDWGPIFKAIKKSPGFWLNLPGYQENIEALYNFRRATNHHLYYVTSRTETIGRYDARTQCEIWLEDKGLLPCGDDRVIISRGEDKHKVYQELGIEFSIDDKPETVYDCLGLPGHQPYLLDRRYNRSWQLPRVYSMAEFCGIVEACEASGKRTSVGGVIA